MDLLLHRPLIFPVPGHNFGVGAKGFISKPLALSPDGKGVVLPGGSHDQLVLWDVQTGQSLRDFNRCYVHYGTWAAFSPDGSRLLARSDYSEGSIQLLDVATGERLPAFGTNWVHVAAFSPDGRQILTQEDEAVTLWDGTSGQALHRLPLPPGGSPNPYGAPSFSSDGSLVMVEGNEAVDVWDAQQGVSIRRIDGDGPSVRSAIFSPDGRQALIVGGFPPAQPMLYSIETGARIRTFEHNESISGAAFSPDGSRVVGWEEEPTVDEETQLQFARAVLWDTTSAERLRMFKHVDNGGINRAGFSADARWILIAGPHCVRLWDAATGDWLRSFEGESPAWFLPDGTAVLTASGPGSAALWDIRDLLARPRIQRDSSGAEVAWVLGTLQYAPTVNGPWSNLPAASPFKVSPIEGEGFYRVQVNGSPANPQSVQGRRTAPVTASAPSQVSTPAYAPVSQLQAAGRIPTRQRARVRKLDVPFIPTPQPVVEKMLELGDIKEGDVVYDLGCGDGRIVITAALKYGVKAVGFDIDPARVSEARANARRNDVEHLVTIREADIFTLDLREASVVTLYLLPELNQRLLPQLAQLKPGSRIVSHDFDLRGVKPVFVHRMSVASKLPVRRESDLQHSIFKWIVPWDPDPCGGLQLRSDVSAAESGAN